MDKVTILFVLGAPGSGKGTQCRRIAERYGWTHLSTGDLIRSEVEAGTELGLQVAEAMVEGLMPNDIILELLTNAMASSGSSRFLVDGFPRTEDQLMEFQTQVKPCDGVLVFSVPEEVAVERLLARGITEGRPDDTEESISARMEMFQQDSQRVIEFLADSGANLHEVDSAAPEEEVFAAVMPFMDEMDQLAAEKEGDGGGESSSSSQDSDADALGDDDNPDGGRVASELSDATLVFVLGTPGCAQDTQCEQVRQRYGWTVITPEEVLREEMDKGSELGQQAADLLAAGEGVPHELLVELLLQALTNTPSTNRRFLLNGFPRYMEQLELFEMRVRPCDGVLILVLPEELAMERLLEAEEYDSEEAVQDRLDGFRVETQPVIDILREQNIQVGDVDATGDQDEVFAQVATFIEGFGAPLDQTPQAEEGRLDEQGQSGRREMRETELEQQLVSDGAAEVYTEEQVQAAIRIQAARRGYEGRKKVAAMHAKVAAAQATVEGHAADSEASADGKGWGGVEYTEEQVAAATRVQAARRGYIDRKRIAAMKAEQHKQHLSAQPQEVQGRTIDQGGRVGSGVNEGQQESVSAAKLEYTDEQVQAAVRIQAAKRGYEARKQMAEMRQAKEAQQQAPAVAAVEAEVPVAADAQGLSYDEAVVRIQAAGRGYLDRKKVAALRAEAETEAKADLVIADLVGSIRGMLVMCGPSGVGKGTLISRLMGEHGDKFGFSISHTTRGPRPGEENGVHYHFTDRPSMQRNIDKHLFLEYADVHGNMYGTSLAAVAAVGQLGRIAILDIDVQGASKIKASRAASKARYVFVDPPSLEVLEARLRGRGTETEDKVRLRLSNASAELERSREPGFFNARLVNDDLEAAYHRLKTTIEQLMPGTFGPGDLRPPPVPSGTPPAPVPAPSLPRVPVVQPPVPPHLKQPTAARTGAVTLPVRQYMDLTVVPVLREALRFLNEQRPDDPLKYLADFLLEARANGGRHPLTQGKGGNGKTVY